jgi:hypothetical protein
MATSRTRNKLPGKIQTADWQQSAVFLFQQWLGGVALAAQTSRQNERSKVLASGCHRLIPFSLATLADGENGAAPQLCPANLFVAGRRGNAAPPDHFNNDLCR